MFPSIVMNSDQNRTVLKVVKLYEKCLLIFQHLPVTLSETKLFIYFVELKRLTQMIRTAVTKAQTIRLEVKLKRPPVQIMKNVILQPTPLEIMVQQVTQRRNPPERLTRYSSDDE